MRLTLRAKIWVTVLSVVLMFAFFVLFYLPSYQGKYLLDNFNKEILNDARTVALGVKIAITEQNFEGVQTAMDYVKNEPYMRFVSLIQVDTSWNKNHSGYILSKSIFKTYPDQYKVNVNFTSNDSMVIKTAPIMTPLLNGEIMVGFTKSGIIERVDQIRKLALLVSIIIFCIGIAIGSWLSKNISIPVLALRDAAIKVGNGDLTQRVQKTSKDEIGELAIAFNKMVNELGIARKQVEDRTMDLIKEKKKSDELLDDLKKTLVNLKETQEQLIRQEKLASIGQLTNGIVDRLLNPLNYINNFSLISIDLVHEILRGRDNSNSETYHVSSEEMKNLLLMIESNLKKISDHGSSASRIVRAMEKLLKEKSNEFVYTDLNALVENNINIASQDLKRDQQECDVKLVTHFDKKNILVRLLPFEMSTVILNLLSNSYYSVLNKYSMNNNYMPEIDIYTRFLESNFEIIVRDNGKGMSPLEMRKLFSPFFTTKQTSKGTGLGLYISQDIVKAHKGNISVQSKEGEYSQFTISIPMN